jgi:hypothetical protein
VNGSTSPELFCLSVSSPGRRPPIRSGTAGQIRSNNTVVRLANNGGGTVHVILDVMGYFE